MPIKDWDAGELVRQMKLPTSLNRARIILSEHTAYMEQQHMQRVPITAIEYRREEFATIVNIAKALGIELTVDI